MKKLVAVLSVVTISSTVFAAPLKAPLKYSCGISSSGTEITLDIKNNVPKARMPNLATFVTSGADSTTGMINPSMTFEMEGDLQDMLLEGNIVKAYIFNEITNFNHQLVLVKDAANGKTIKGVEINLLDNSTKDLTCNLVK